MSVMPEVSLSFACDGLTVSIDTERLHLRSVLREDIDDYCLLYGDAEGIKYFADGIPRDRDYVTKRIENIWMDRWRNGDAFSAFAIFLKSSGSFIGHIALGYPEFSLSKNCAELTFLLKRAYRENGYEKEAVSALIHEYFIAIKAYGIKMRGSEVGEIISACSKEDSRGEEILNHSA